LQAEFAAANAKIAEVQGCKNALISDYQSLHSDYSMLESGLEALMKEKEDLEKSEREKAQRFRQLLCTKLHGLWRNLEKSVAELGGQCFEFPSMGATVGGMLDWFRTEVRALPNTFAKANQNITCYVVAWLVF
jgi:hypothetical protein